MNGQQQSGFTLLEVVLALAILAVSMAALGEVLRMGGESSRIARDLTRAQLIASTKLAELSSGAAVLDSVSNATVEEIETEPRWLFSVEIGSTSDPNLIAVRVTTRQDLPENLNPVTYSIVRWMQDPSVLAAATGSASGSTTGGGLR